MGRSINKSSHSFLPVMKKHPLT